MSEEKPIWNGSPSQVINIPAFVVLGLLVWLVVPIFLIIWRWLNTHMTKYELTTERFRTRSGVFDKKLEELELYRVRDYKLDEPFFLRIFSLGNITLQTSDLSNPVIVIRAIPNAEQLRDQIRNSVEACRMKKGVREVDVV
jgi:uncharacterized membrane protein YdbT with pleckstrin-like domain